jgi:hypothetical protein
MEQDQDEEIELFYGLMSSIGFEKRISKILVKCIGYLDIDEAKHYLAGSESVRERLQFLVDRNQEGGDRMRLDAGLAILQKVLGNIYKEPQNEKYQSLRFDSVALAKVIGLTGGVEFLETCGFEKITREKQINLCDSNSIAQVDTFLVWNPNLLPDALKCFCFIVAILEANYFDPDAVAKDMWKGGGSDGEAARKKLQKRVEREALANHERAWKEAWDSRVDDRNWVCHCCWREIVQYKARSLNTAGWYDSGNERGGYGYRFECEDCKDYHLCQECYEQWEEQLSNSAKLVNSQKQQLIHDLNHTFRSHAPENKVKVNRGAAPDPRKYRRKWG